MKTQIRSRSCEPEPHERPSKSRVYCKVRVSVLFLSLFLSLSPSLSVSLSVYGCSFHFLSVCLPLDEHTFVPRHVHTHTRKQTCKQKHRPPYIHTYIHTYVRTCIHPFTLRFVCRVASPQILTSRARSTEILGNPTRESQLGVSLYVRVRQLGIYIILYMN